MVICHAGKALLALGDLQSHSHIQKSFVSSVSYGATIPVSCQVLPMSRDSSRGAAALEMAAEFGQGDLKISLLLHICTDPGGDDRSPEVVTTNVSWTIKIVRGHCTFLP